MIRIGDYVRERERLRAAGSTPEAVAERRRRFDQEEVRRAGQAAAWPLSADELARRAASDAKPADLSWQAGAVDLDCPECRELGRACVGHLGAWASASAARLSDCEACGGVGRVLVDVNGRMNWEACGACNAVPPYPGLKPGCLAGRAMPRGPRPPETRGELARAKWFWRTYRPESYPSDPDRPKVEPLPGGKFGLPGVFCSEGCPPVELPANAWKPRTPPLDLEMGP